MNVYSILKINRLIRSSSLKKAGIWLFHILNKRYVVVFFDPTLACNLRCRMCYFSNSERRSKLSGLFAQEDLPRLAEVIFNQTLKLQIGCGAEPSLYKYNLEIIQLAKRYKVPYISFTTNANLLSEEEIPVLISAGLNEFTISLHGVLKSTYEGMMVGASYERFLSVMSAISEAKRSFKDFKLRVNYTVNDYNIDELESFFSVFKSIDIDILQVRPIQDIGGEIKSIENEAVFNEKFNRITMLLKEQCAERSITYIAPSHLSNEESKVNVSSSVTESVYCYISPKSFWFDDWEWRQETFREYSKRVKYSKQLFYNIFKKSSYTKTKLNYDIN